MRREPGHPILDFDDEISGRDAEPPRRGARLAVIAVLAGAMLVALAIAAFAAPDCRLPTADCRSAPPEATS